MMDRTTVRIIDLMVFVIMVFVILGYIFGWGHWQN